MEMFKTEVEGATRKEVTVDLFPAYDEDGGLLVALTPRTGWGAMEERIAPSPA